MYVEIRVCPTQEGGVKFSRFFLERLLKTFHVLLLLVVVAGCGAPKLKPEYEKVERLTSRLTAQIQSGEYDTKSPGMYVDMALVKMRRNLDRYSKEDQERVPPFIKAARASLRTVVETSYTNMVDEVVNNPGKEKLVDPLIYTFAAPATKAKWKAGTEARMARQEEVKAAQEKVAREERLQQLNKGVMLRFSKMNKTLKGHLEEHIRTQLHPTPVLVMDTALMPFVSRSMVVVDCTEYFEYEAYGNQVSGLTLGGETHVANGLRLKVRMFSQDPDWTYDEVQTLEVERDLPENIELSLAVRSRPNPRIGEGLMVEMLFKKLGDLQLPEAKRLEELAQTRKPPNKDPDQDWIKLSSTTAFQQVHSRTKPGQVLGASQDGGPETLAGMILTSLRPRCGGLPLLSKAEATVWELKREPAGVLELTLDVVQTPYLKDKAIMYQRGGSVPTSAFGSLTVSGEAFEAWQGDYKLNGNYSPPDTLHFKRIKEESFDALQHLAKDMITSLHKKIDEPTEE